MLVAISTDACTFTTTTTTTNSSQCRGCIVCHHTDGDRCCGRSFADGSAVPKRTAYRQLCICAVGAICGSVGWTLALLGPHKHANVTMRSRRHCHSGPTVCRKARMQSQFGRQRGSSGRSVCGPGAWVGLRTATAVCSRSLRVIICRN